MFFFIIIIFIIQNNGHKEDITCIAKSETNLLASASYDGEIIVWNMVSGHIFCKLNSPEPQNYRDENCIYNYSLSLLLIIKILIISLV